MAVHPAFHSINRYFFHLLVLLLLVSVVLAILLSRNIAYSVMLGGGVCLGPTWLFAWIVFRVTGARRRKEIVFHFYWGEAVKLISTVVLFSLIFASISVQALGFFGGFIAMQLLMWLTPLMIK